MKNILRQIGNNLKSMDKILLVFIILFAAFGLVVVFSSSNITAVLFYHKEPTYFFFKQVTFTILGIAAMFVLAYFLSERHYFWISIIGMIVLLQMVSILMIVLLEIIYY